MSTAARKARKRSGEKFIHTAKVGTPVMERGIGPSYGPSGSDMTTTRRSGRQLKKRWARLKITNPPVVDEKQKVDSAELDPKPYRIGRKRFALNDLHEMATGNWPDNTTPNDLIFSPRKGYEQEQSKY